MKEPAIAMIEFKSVAKGIFVTDAIAKKAPVRILETHPVCPGKYMLLFCGEVEDVQESWKTGRELAGDLLVNELLLPNVHPSIIPALTGTTDIKQFGAIAVIETFSIASCVLSADIAAKKAEVELVEIRLAQGLGGKGYFVMTGKLLEDVQAAFEAARDYARHEGLLAGSELIPNPHPDLINKGIYW